MDTIVSANQYDVSIRESIKKGRITLVYVFLGISLVELLIGLFLSGFSTEGFMEIGIYFLIPVAILLVIAIVFYFLARNVDKADFVHFTYDKYKNYKENNFKHPTFRIRHYGRTSETIYQIMELDQDNVKIIDVRKTKDEDFIDAKKKDVVFQFIPTTNNGLYPFRAKIVLRISGKIVIIYSFKEYNEKLYNYLKKEGYEVNIK